MAQSVAVAVGDIGDELVARLSKKAEASESWAWHGQNI